MRRPRAVVVHAQSAAAVHEVHVIPHLVELDIELRCFPQRRLYAAYLGYLTADVEMYQAQTVLHALLFENLESREEFRTGKPELAGVATALLPLAAARRGELDAHAEVGPHAEFLSRAGDSLQFVELLHHDEDAFAHLLRQKGQLDIVLVLVAVAHDERVALALHGDHGVEFGLGAALETEVELASVADDLLHHGLHLVHLYGVYHEALARVAVFLGRLGEAARRFLDAVVEDVGKPEQHGRGDVAQGKLVHHLSQVHPGVVLARRDAHVALFVYLKIGCSPSPHVVKLLGVFDSPFLHSCSMCIIFSTDSFILSLVSSTLTSITCFALR